MSDSPPPLLIRQVSALLDQHPTTRLVVFVSRPQLGTALQEAVGRARGRTAGLIATTVEQYAHDCAALSLRASGRTALDAGPQFFFTEQAVRSLDDDQRSALTGGQPLAGLVAPLARTFETLRLHAISPSAYRAQADNVPHRVAQAEAFARYEALLEQREQYDTADLFDEATALVRSSSLDLSATVWALEDTVTLSTVEHRFLDTLQQTATVEPALYRLGPTVMSNAPDASVPDRSAAAHFPEAPRPHSASAAPSPVGRLALSPGDDLPREKASTLQFWTATGTRREVQAVFDDILAADRPLDTVEIAYTTPDPYLPLLDTLAERYNVPVSLSGGRSVDATRPGQALRGFFEWIAEDCPIPNLIALLRAGLLRLDTPIGNTGDHLDSQQAATLLAEQRYPDDCRKYSETFTSWRAALASEARAVDAIDAPWGEKTAQRHRAKAEAVKAVQKTVEALLKLAQMKDRTRVSPTSLAAGAERLLEEYGPTPPPADDEERRTPDQAARNRLLDRLQSLQELEDTEALPPPQLAGRMATWLGLSPFVQAQRPRPGRAHVVPLESAGYAGRDHLYVLGLDAASTQSAVPDDPLLSDEDRRALSGDDRSLPLRSAQADIEAWRTRQALARHEGPVTFSASTYNLAEDEDLFEAPLFLRLKEAAQAARGVDGDADDPQVEHHALAPNADTLLSDLDRWTSRERPSSEVLDEAMDKHSWIQHGLDAAAARTTETYTPYDGVLEARSYPGLDPLSGARPVSAGRLETYAQAPYAYFLRHVLGVEPLDEPALDDVAWLDPMGRGAVLHDTFQRFMSTLGRQPTLDDTDQLRDVFETVLDEKRDQHPPPSEVVYASTRRQLWNDARLFLRAEAARTDDHVPHKFELGFGYPPHRRSKDDYDEAPTLEVGELSFPLRGRIDRVDQLDDHAVALWDYKTGSSSGYDEADLVTEDFHLQWALYAYAYEALAGVDVSTAGYFFTSTDEMGKRISADPTAQRETVGRVLQRISAGIRAGAFPVTDAGALRYNYDRLFPNFSERKKQLDDKAWPSDRPAPPSFQSD